MTNIDERRPEVGSRACKNSVVHGSKLAETAVVELGHGARRQRVGRAVLQRLHRVEH